METYERISYGEVGDSDTLGILVSTADFVCDGVQYVDSTCKAANHIEADSRRCWCTSPRALGFGNTKDFDRFLLLDDFRNDVPEDYLAGFPWHLHRGIETITYVLAGTVEHGDSIGNSGVIGAGDVCSG